MNLSSPNRPTRYVVTWRDQSLDFARLDSARLAADAHRAELWQRVNVENRRGLWTWTVERV